jgi:hypothetical protein
MTYVSNTNCKPDNLSIVAPINVQSPPKEIEIKAIITDQEFDGLKLSLPAMAKPLGVTMQEDIYLDNPANSFIFLNNAGYKDANE